MLKKMKPSKAQINQAVEILRSGGTVVFPTETSYGLATDATDLKAVRRLIQIKGRGPKTLPVIVSSLAMAKKFVRINSLALKMAQQFWPGALTMVLPVRDNALTGVTPFCIKNKQIAIRVSSNEIACELSRQLGKPIVATSANRSGQPDCYSIRAVRSRYKNQQLQPDYYLDAGALPKRKPSTLVKVENNIIEVLRKGSLCPSFLKNHLDSTG